MLWENLLVHSRAAKALMAALENKQREQLVSQTFELKNTLICKLYMIPSCDCTQMREWLYQIRPNWSYHSQSDVCICCSSGGSVRQYHLSCILGHIMHEHPLTLQQLWLPTDELSPQMKLPLCLISALGQTMQKAMFSSHQPARPARTTQV